MHVGLKCDKHASDAHDESMKHLLDRVVNFPGDAMEISLGLVMLCVDDKTHNCAQTCEASINNCHFHNVKEATEDADNNHLDDKTIFFHVQLMFIKMLNRQCNIIMLNHHLKEFIPRLMTVKF